jgi:serine/threonine-protein kinase
VVAGRYVLLEELGRGSCATVHRALDRRSGAVVAAKVAREPSARERLRRESGHVVVHPHVVPVCGWVEDEETSLLAAELVTGGSVRDLLRRERRLSPPLVARLLDHLLDALDAVHGHGLVHGDVAPGNLLLRPGPRPHLLLADFGVTTPTGRPGPVEGTPAWQAPERRAGAPPHPSQDVHAAGLLARRALAGPAPLLTLADTMTRADPERRPTAAQARRRLRELTWPG